MEITAITSQKKRKDRFNIFIDGKYAFALDGETLLKHHLKKNQPVTQDYIEQLIKESEFAKWYNQTLMLISKRPRSQKEIKDYLQRKEIGEKTLDLVIEKLQAKKFIDDSEFASWFVEQRLAFRPKGKRMLRLELGQKGIAPDIIDGVLEDKVSRESEYEQALVLARNKLPQTAVFDLELKKKIYGFLGRRGFAWETIEAVWRDLKAQI